MRLPRLLAIAIGAMAVSPAHAADQATVDSVVVLRGTSAPPAPWNEPPPPPEVQIVYVPVYDLPLAYGTFFARHHHKLAAARHR
jgi:hypothetical protein